MSSSANTTTGPEYDKDHNNHHQNENDKDASQNNHVQKSTATFSSTSMEWLPAHTDPSLLSIVIHDPNNHQEDCCCHDDSSNNNNGFSGLQYYHNRQWHILERPPSPSKSSKDENYSNQTVVAVVLVGSVLSALTGGQVPACRHRVVYHHPDGSPSSCHCRRRAAVTLFGRPAPTAWMQRLPPFLATTTTTTKQRPPLQFQQWLARVARNYERAKTTTTTRSPTLTTQTTKKKSDPKEEEQ
ncbi:hypothetical protein ACA910_010444 [Epithemia clementina (nom. ined.)]